MQWLRIVQAPLPREAREVYVRSSSDVAALAAQLLRHEADEVMLCFYLNTKHNVLGAAEAGRGGIDYVPCEPRAVFRVALLCNAAAIVLAHNHPSGDPMPSPQDRELTRRIARAGDLMGVPLLDHIIVGADAHVSLLDMDRNLFEP